MYCPLFPWFQEEKWSSSLANMLKVNSLVMLRREHVKALWKLTGGFEIVDIGHGFFMVQFDIEADKEKVLEGGTYFQAGTNNNTPWHQKNDESLDEESVKMVVETPLHNSMLKTYPLLLRKFISEAKVSLLVEIERVGESFLKNFTNVLQLMKEAFFKHGDEDLLRACVKAINFCCIESRGCTCGLRRLLEVSRSRGGRRPEEDQSNTQHDLKVKPAFSSAYTRASWSINSLVIGQIDRRSWIGIRQNCSPKLVWFRRLLSFEINDPKGVIYSLLMGFFLRDLSSKKAGFLVFLAYLGGLRRLLEVPRSRGGRRPEEDAGELQDFARNKLKGFEDEIIDNLKSAIREVVDGGDEYCLLANLRRLRELQLSRYVN
ncbi:DUF4283 domain protein [Medicago truncatula]|uniref:DUF4283 domain protein n=1 Tax=Medicago truncatula TaxID=3880 RepID=G7K3I4_MEDTR|nr:DUF4283 domain protein [Medicago truncatula]